MSVTSDHFTFHEMARRYIHLEVSREFLFATMRVTDFFVERFPPDYGTIAG